MKEYNCNNLVLLNEKELSFFKGGVDPAEGSYAAGYAIGAWFREMYSIWSYGLTHLTDR
ncbi:hypothetical protein [Lutimonas zeaxanthinifaciens]|uniref:hypothetical protein n=1 Tax=Lutimonas zeaxanthinifaciens TaxID=3060215 RepID=UPI00265D16F7|nr:hypothetical protein [Lutimonas sp. YSD2104]WKK66009.1 hypothetical protein QZH61_15650 [Lutimonas sp. YSD2104]